MAKKINLAERISEMVNDDAARTYIREHTLYPAVLLSGTRIGAEEKVRYLCLIRNSFKDWKILRGNREVLYGKKKS